jgi:DNA-binding MarR family transcriptional regulator
MSRPHRDQSRAVSEQKAAAEHAVIGLLRAADSIRRALDESFAAFDVTGQQYNVLRILRGAGDPLPTMEVADRMMEKTPGLTGILDRLERKGLVERRRSAADRRVWLCSLSVAGRELLHEMEAPVRRANVDALSGMREPELRAVVEALERFYRESP